MNDLLQYINILLIPMLVYLVKIEIRLTKMEVMQSVEYKFLAGRHRQDEENS